MNFTKKDLFFSLITGFITGLVVWRIFVYLRVPQFESVSFAWFMLAVPLLWIVGVNLGYFLGRWFSFFHQFGKFAAIGFTNAAVDFGVLNLLISSTGIATGLWFSVFKASSFVGATLHSYVWNKYWTFNAGESKGGGMEFAKFFVVTFAALLVNVAIASFIVNAINPTFNLTPEAWANVAAVIGSAIALVVSFLGFRIIVFKKNN